jgi:predicted negative regulator of RcsB-dependent stress response
VQPGASAEIAPLPQLHSEDCMASPSVARTRRPSAAVQSDDAFAMRAAEVAEWAKRNIRRIVTVAGALAVLMLLAVGYFLMQRSNASRASVAYLELSAGNAQGPQRTTQLEAFVAQYGGTNEGKEARLELAGLYLDANQPARALPHAREVAGSGGNLKYQGQLMLGSVLARTGDRAGAIQAYRDAAATARMDFQRAEALNQAAILQEGAGNWQGAAELYREMLKDTKEGTMDRSIIEMRLSETEAKIATARR